MAADIRLRWVLELVDRGVGKTLLKQDREIRSSLAKTDAQYKRSASSGVSASRRQAEYATKAAKATTALGKAEGFTASEAKRYAASQRETLAIGQRMIGTSDKVTAAYRRQGAAARAAAAEEKKWAGIRSKTAKVGGAVAGGVGRVVGGTAKVAGATVLAGGVATVVGMKKAGELAQTTAGIKGLTGLSAQDATSLGILSNAMQINARSLGMAFGTLGKQVLGLEKGAKSSTEAFTALKISPQQVAQLKNNLPALFDLVYERTQKLPAAQRAGYLKQLLGRGGMVAGQVEQLGPLAGQIKELNATTGGLDPKRLEQLRVAQLRLKVVTTSLELAFAETFGPPLIALMQLITPAVKPIGEALKTLIQKPLEWLKDHGPGIWKDVKAGIGGIIEGGKAAVEGKPTPHPKGTLPVRTKPGGLGGEPTVAIGVPRILPGRQLPGPYRPGQGIVGGGVGKADPFSQTSAGVAKESTTWQKLGHTIVEVGKTIGKYASKMGRELVAALKPMMPFITGVVIPAFKLLAKVIGPILWGAWKIAVTGIKLFAWQLGLVGKMARAVGGAAQWLGGALVGAFKAVVGFFSRLPGVVASAASAVWGWLKGLPGKALSVGERMAGGIVHGVETLISKVADLGKTAFNALWELGRNLVKAIVAGILSLPGAIWDAIKGLAGKGAGLLESGWNAITGQRAGGVVGMRGGGVVPARVSPGEQVVYGGRSWRVPGARTSSDSVTAMLPIGAAVLTGSGQGMMRRGASLGQAIARQAPHFASGGWVTAVASREELGGLGYHSNPISASGYSELGVPPTHENIGTALGKLPYHALLRIKSGNRTVTASKQDIGTGSSFNPRLGLYPGTIASLGLSGGQFNVQIQRVDGGALSGTSSGTMPIMLGASRTREGLVGEALTEGVSAGSSGLSRAEIRAARKGARGARGNPVLAGIAEAVGAVTKAITTRGPSTAQAGATGGASSWPTSLSPHEVASWIVPEIRYAQAHGWAGQITSGYRPNDKGSEHSKLSYPGGAIDFGGEHEAAALANRTSFVNATKDYHGKRLLLPQGFVDDGHMSGSGHRRGGIVGFRKGGRAASANGWVHTSRGSYRVGPVHYVISALSQIAPNVIAALRGAPSAPSAPGATTGAMPVVSAPSGSTPVDASEPTPTQEAEEEQEIANLGRRGGFLTLRGFKRFRRGGRIGGEQGSQALGAMTSKAGNAGAFKGALESFDELLGGYTSSYLNTMRAQLVARARKGGSAAVVKSLQAAISAIDFELGSRIGAYVEQVSKLGAQADRASSALDRTLRRAGVDPSSSQGLAATLGGDAKAQEVRRQQVVLSRKALALANKTGNRTLIGEMSEQLATAQGELDEAITKGMEDARSLLRTAAQEIAEGASALVTHAQNVLSGLDIAQRLSGTSGTAGGMAQKAAGITSTLLPALWQNLNALNSQLAVATATGSSASEITSITQSIESAGLEIGGAMADAADLIREAAETAAADTVERAAHGTTMADLGKQRLELQERIGGTFDTAGTQRADFIRTSIIPALEAEVAALQIQQATASQQGDAKLAEQIGEAVYSKQNEVLQATLDATEQVAENTDQRKVGGSLAFSYGDGSLTDAIVGVGNGA